MTEETKKKRYNLAELSDEEKERNREKALKARRDRAEVKKNLTTDAKTAKEGCTTHYVLHHRKEYPYSKITVYQLITSLPGYGRVTATKICRALSLREDMHLRQLGPKQAQELYEEIPTFMRGGWPEDPTALPVGHFIDW